MTESSLPGLHCRLVDSVGRESLVVCDSYQSPTCNIYSGEPACIARNPAVQMEVRGSKAPGRGLATMKGAWVDGHLTGLRSSLLYTGLLTLRPICLQAKATRSSLPGISALS